MFRQYILPDEDTNLFRQRIQQAFYFTVCYGGFHLKQEPDCGESGSCSAVVWLRCRRVGRRDHFFGNAVVEVG